MKENKFFKIILTVIAVGIWMLVLQGFGFFPSQITTQDVYVRGGELDADVYVRGGSIDVDNTVDVNLDRVLDRPVGCHKSYTIDGREYQAIDVFKSNW